MDTNKEGKEVKVRLLKIQETDYFIDSPLLQIVANDTPRSNFDVEVGFNLPQDTDNNTFEIRSIAFYYYTPEQSQKEQEHSTRKKALELGTLNLFEFDDVKEYFTFKEGGLEDKFNVLPILLNISIGALRGILVAKTAGTCLSNFPLPLISIESFKKTPEDEEKEGEVTADSATDLSPEKD